MKEIEHALKLISLKEIDEQIKMRCQLISNMDGQLYSGNAHDEIIRLNERYSEIFTIVKTNKNYYYGIKI